MDEALVFTVSPMNGRDQVLKSENVVIEAEAGHGCDAFLVLSSKQSTGFKVSPLNGAGVSKFLIIFHHPTPLVVPVKSQAWVELCVKAIGVTACSRARPDSMTSRIPSTKG